MKRAVTVMVMVLVLSAFLIAPVLGQNGNIKDKIKDKDVKERARIKAQEIAAVKTLGERVRADKPNHLKYDLMLCQYNAEKNTLKLKFRVWLNGVEKAVHNPVDIYNPPILVVTSESYDPITDEYSYTTEENVEAVIDEVIYRAAMSAPDGAATFDNGDPELWVFALWDDYLEEDTDALFATIRAANGDVTNPGDTENRAMIRTTAAGADTYTYLLRTAWTFDGSGVGASNTVTAARLDLYGFAKYQNIGAPNFSITGFNPNTFTVYEVLDYRRFLDTKYATDIQYGSFNTGSYNNITLNSAGVANVNKSGYFAMMGRLRWDADNSQTGLVWIADTGNKYSGFMTCAVNTAGTGSDPALFVTYTVVEPDRVYIQNEQPGGRFIPAVMLALVFLGIIGAASYFYKYRRRG